MSCSVASIQYIVAVLRLHRQGRRFARTMHFSFVPDEEISGRDGMVQLLKDPWFQTLRVGVAMDEGIASETAKYTVFYGERAIWWLKIRATGPTGHASRLPVMTAMQNLIASINQFLAFRETQVAKLHGDGCKHAQATKLGDVLSLNLTMLKGTLTH
jgi:aminoacylase